jgi:hypothetical protein
MDIDDEMKRRASDIEDRMKKAMGENVYGFLNRMKDVYGYYEDENGITDINLTDKERDKAIEFLISVLKELGIEKPAKPYRKCLVKRFDHSSTRAGNFRYRQGNLRKITRKFTS